MPLPLIPAAMKATGADKYIDTALKGAVAISAVTGSFLLVRHVVRQAKDNKVDRKALQQNTPAYFATLIGSTLNSQYWYGDLLTIDRENLYRIFRSIPQEVKFQDIEAAFHARYEISLVDELESKLYPDEYRKVLSIIHY